MCRKRTGGDGGRDRLLSCWWLSKLCRREVLRAPLIAWQAGASRRLKKSSPITFAGNFECDSFAFHNRNAHHVFLLFHYAGLAAET